MNDNERWMNRQRAMREAYRALCEIRLQQIESRYELENDEFQTAREKAIQIERNQTQTVRINKQ